MGCYIEVEENWRFRREIVLFLGLEMVDECKKRVCIRDSGIVGKEGLFTIVK